MKRLTCALTGLAFTFVAGAPVMAQQTPRDLRDIVGDGAKPGRKELERRGYHKVDSTRSRDGAYINFWNPESRRCVTAHRVGNRLDTIVSAPAFDCGQHDVDTYERSDDDDNTGAAIAVGAAALIGALALSHKSHHHDNNEHHSSADMEADFDRGYRDGLHGSSYHNYSNTPEYSRGYESGVEQREHETSYRHQHSRYSSGYRESVNMTYMVGERARNLGNQMENRGFRNVDVLTSGNAKYDIFYNDRTRQCLQATIVDGRVEDIRDIHRHPNCR